MTTHSAKMEGSAHVHAVHDDHGHDSCGCGHSHGTTGNSDDHSLKKQVGTLVIGVLVYLVVLILDLPFWYELALFLMSYLIIAWDVVWTAFKNILQGRFFDEFFLMTVATIGAFAIQEFPEAVGVMLFYKVGELFQDMALDKSRNSITALMEIRPEYANLQLNGEMKQVDPKTVEVGNILLVKPGERVPLDGLVLDGSSMLDTSALTGESKPKKVLKGDEILSGMINQSGLLIIRVTKSFGESTVSKILDLVENASAKKAPTEKFITKFAKIYTPIVVFAAIALAVVPVLLYNIPTLTPLFAHQETFSEWIYKALIFLVISCPCALVISIPLGFFGGIGAASKSGVLVKGSNYLEGLNNLHTVVWDKTGTLTKGDFKVTQVNAYNGFSEEDVLNFAAQAESQSDHPIAKSILEAFKIKIDELTIESYQEVSGHGIKARINGKDILAGNDKLMQISEIKHDTCKARGTIVHIAVNTDYVGYLVISDEIKEDTKTAIRDLKAIGVKKQIMLTGDRKEVASSVANELGLDEFHAELLPQEKMEKVETLISKKTNTNHKIVFVGDGINDAPVLIRSDIGVAMGGLGSDAAIESADIVLMSDEPSRIPEAVKIAKRTRTIVWQNIVFAMGIKGVFLTMGAFGMATMWEAVFADVGVALLAILNATRVPRRVPSK